MTAQLVLTLAHDADGMSPEAFESTVRATVRALDEISPPPLAIPDSPDSEEKKDDSHPHGGRRRPPPAQVHVLVAGPKRVVGNGRGIDRPDWEKLWTYGEAVFGAVVRCIGLERFSPRAETQVVANLLDVRPASAPLTAGRGGGGCATASGGDDGALLLEEIASLCHSTLRHRSCPPVDRATVIVPVDVTGAIGEEAAELGKAYAIERAKTALGRKWEGSSLLRDATVDFVAVGVR